MKEIFEYTTYGIPGAPAGHDNVVHRPMLNIWVQGATRSIEQSALADTGADLTIFPMNLCDEGLLDPEFLDDEEEDFVAGDGGNLRVKYGMVNLFFILNNVPLVWGCKVGFSRDRKTTVLGQVGFLRHFGAFFDGPRCRLTLLHNHNLPSRHLFMPSGSEPSGPAI